MSLGRKGIAISTFALLICSQYDGQIMAEEICTSPLFQTTGINYDPTGVEPGTTSTARLSMELLADFMGNGILAGQPTNV